MICCLAPETLQSQLLAVGTFSGRAEERSHSVVGYQVEAASPIIQAVCRCFLVCRGGNGNVTTKLKRIWQINSLAFEVLCGQYWVRLLAQMSV